jgi:hypothetical protein
MPTPTGSERRFLAAGARKAAAWRTPLALGATYGLNCKSISGFNPSRDLLVAQEVDSPLAFSGALNIYKPQDFTITSDMLYSPGQLGMLIASLFGTAGTPAGPTDTTAYTHTFQWANGNGGLFATVAVEMPGIIFECASAKVMEWSLKSAAQGFVQSEVKLRGNKIIDSSAVNTATQMDALTYDERTNHVKYEVQNVKMNAQSAGDVTGATALEVTGVEVSYKRTGHDGIAVSGFADIQEPAEGGYPDIRIKLKFPHMDAVNKLFLATAVAETTQKMLIKYTHNVLAGAATVYYSMSLYFPRLRMLCPEASWDEIVSYGIELVAEEASAAPTGMAYTRPYVQLVNKRATDYLA